jgi:hypothetical protein
MHGLFPKFLPPILCSFQISFKNNFLKKENKAKHGATISLIPEFRRLRKKDQGSPK